MTVFESAQGIPHFTLKQSNIEGFSLQVIVTDTAGLRETGDAIEAEGVVRARQAAQSSHIVLAIADAASPSLDASLTGLVSSIKDASSPAEKSMALETWYT